MLGGLGDFAISILSGVVVAIFVDMFYRFYRRTVSDLGRNKAETTGETPPTQAPPLPETPPSRPALRLHGQQPWYRLGMNLWRDRDVAIRLRRNDISEIEKLKYLSATLLFYTSMTTITARRLIGDETGTFGALAYAYDSFMLILAVVLIIYAFVQNRKGDGLNFIERYICVSFPLTIKLTVYIIIGVTLATTISFMIIDMDPDGVEGHWSTHVILVLALVATYTYMALRYRYLMAIASGRRPDLTDDAPDSA